MDMMKKICIEQGYVPETCTMNGQLCWQLVRSQGNPCIGCNEDKSICQTKNKTE